MAILNNISVKHKIVLIITTISAISVLFSLFFNLSTKIIETKKELRDDAIKDAKLIGDYCVMPIEFNYPERAEEVLIINIRQPRIFCAAVYNKDGELFSSSCNLGGSVPDSILHNNSLVEFEGNELFVIEPIYHNENYYGSVFILYYTGLRSFIFRQLAMTLLVLFLVIILSLFLAFHFQKFITTPILELAEKASEISDTQNYKIKLERFSNDEIGILYDRFNQMLSAINSRELERDGAAEALLRSEEKFRNMFNFSLDGILLTDMKGKVLDVNRMAASIFDIPTEKLKSMSSVEFMPPSYSRQRTIFIKELEYKGEFIFVTNYITPADKEIYLEFSSRIINQDGQRCIFSLIRDITKRLKADDALRESEERYKKLVENFPSAIVLHREGKIVFVNDSIKTILEGESKREFIGKDILELAPKKSIKTIKNHFKTVLEYNATSTWIEVKMKKLDGTEIDVEMSSIPLFFDKRRTILSIFNDISARKKIEKALVIAMAKAEESDKLKSAFLANMSHEIRTPMNGIIGFADLLNSESLEKKDINRYVSVIKSSADRLLSIINDIIDISKIEVGVINVNKEKFLLNELIEEIYQFFKPQAQGKGVDLKLSNRKEISLILYSDRSKISQVITNLISNSLKFTHNGFISLGWKHHKKRNLVEIIVEDTGIGIPKEQLELIFERFHQSDNYLQDFSEGTGLGLSICKGFAVALEGNIWVESEFEKGSTFHFELPVKDEESQSDDTLELKNENIKPDLSNKSILIVEDEKYNYMYLNELLQGLGADVLWADDGLKAIQFALNNPQIDLVLMDIKLPIMDGITAAQKIKTFRNQLPIIAQTAFGLEQNREKSIAAGLDDYLSKPISQKELYRIIDKYIKK
jgi:PAS domain S-box-containing protein